SASHYRDLDQSLKLTYAVIDVNDIVAHLEVTQIREERFDASTLPGCLRAGSLPGCALDVAKHVAFHQDRKRGGRQRKPVSELAYRGDDRKPAPNFETQPARGFEGRKESRVDLVLCQHLLYSLCHANTGHHKQPDFSLGA